MAGDRSAGSVTTRPTALPPSLRRSETRRRPTMGELADDRRPVSSGCALDGVMNAMVGNSFQPRQETCIRPLFKPSDVANHLDECSLDYVVDAHRTLYGLGQFVPNVKFEPGSMQEQKPLQRFGHR